MKLLITGSNGFLGTNLVEILNGNHELVLLGRGRPKPVGRYRFFKGEISGVENYLEALVGVECVIHCAARVHQMNDCSSNSLEEYRKVNVAGTINLASQSVKAGVKRFIFISSVKVNGESTTNSNSFRPTDMAGFNDFYGQTKYEAEEQLLALAQKTGLEVVVIRPTLIYGPGVKANFASLLKLVSRGLPLPFGCIINNKRSLVSVRNLVDLIVTCIEHPNAVNQIFLVSDDHDVSTASMVKYMSQALGKSCRLLPVPLWCYRLVGTLTGKMDVVDRLLGSLQVDITHTKTTLGWIPPQTLEQGFKETAEAFLLNNKEMSK